MRARARATPLMLQLAAFVLALQPLGAATFADTSCADGRRSLCVPELSDLQGQDFSALDWLDEGPRLAGAAFSDQQLSRFRSARRDLSLGFRTAPVWFHLQVMNPTQDARQCVVELGFSPEHAELYVQRAGQLSLLARSGTGMPFASRPLQAPRIAFRVAVPAHADVQMFLRIASRDVIWPRATLWSEAGFARITIARGLTQGLLYGLLLAMIMYNAFIYASTRERTYLLYVMFEATTLAFLTALDKTAFQYLWPETPDWAQNSEQVFSALAGFAAVRFSLAFLSVGLHAPRLSRALARLSLIELALVPIAALTSYTPVVIAMGLILVVNLLGIGVAAIVCLGRDPANARVFLLGWAPLLIGGALAVLAGLGLISNDFFVALKLGSATEAMILALALANRINIIRRAREQADAELLAARAAHTVLLEQRVATRTFELSETITRLKLTQEKLIRQERLTALAGMVAGMAHEVGNPLNFAQGGADVLDRQLTDLANTWTRLDANPCASNRNANAASMRSQLADARRALGLVSGGLQRITKIMVNLRGYMQLRVLDNTPTDLVAEIKSTLTIVEDALARSGVRVITDFAPLPMFMCRAGELNQVFMNILLNACRVLDQGGVIEITTRATRAGGIEIRFADNGPGVVPALRDAIFEPFFSERALAGAGTGLGLYIAREIVARHGGELSLIDSERGACFVIRFAASDVATTAGTAKSSAA